MGDQEESKCLKQFFKQLKKYGKYQKLAKLYGKESEASTIIVGEVHNVAHIIERPNRKLNVVVFREVRPDGSKGKLFSLFAFDKFAEILKATNPVSGDIIGICGADIERVTCFKDKEEHSQYRARLGFPKKKGRKLVMMKKVEYEETLRKRPKSNISKTAANISKRRQDLSNSNQSTSNKELNISETTNSSQTMRSKSSVENAQSTSKTSRSISASAPSTSKTTQSISASAPSTSKTTQSTSASAPSTSKTTESISASAPSTSKTTESISASAPSTSKTTQSISASAPSTSKAAQSISASTTSKMNTSASRSRAETSGSRSRPNAVEKAVQNRCQIQRPAGPARRYQYTKLGELKKIATRLNTYGIISKLLKKRENYELVDIVDETLPSDRTFKLHIFKGTAPTLPDIIEGHIIRVHRMKTEEFEKQLDGRVFDGRDVVIFPAEGDGTEGAQCVSRSFHFDNIDAKRLIELRQWIVDEYSRRAVSPTPTSREGSITGDDDGNYNNSVKTLEEIESEGHYILHCKVLECHHKKGKTVLIVTDGTIPSRLITGEETHSSDGRHGMLPRTVRVVLKSETHMKLQNEFVRMLGVEAELVTDAYSERTCLSFVLQRVQSIKIMQPSHYEAKVITRRLKKLSERVNCSVSTEAADAERSSSNQHSKRGSSYETSGITDCQETSSQTIESGHSRKESKRTCSDNKDTRINDANKKKTNQDSNTSTDASSVRRHQHFWHDPQPEHGWLCSQKSVSSNLNRETASQEITLSDCRSNTSVENCNIPNSEVVDRNYENIISYIYDIPQSNAEPIAITDGYVASALSPIRVTPMVTLIDKENDTVRQSSSSDCEIVYSPTQSRLPLVPRANSKDGSELLKSLKQKARRRVYGEGHEDHVKPSGNSFVDEGLQEQDLDKSTVPSQMSYKDNQNRNCGCLELEELRDCVHHCLSRIARVEPVSREQEDKEPKISTGDLDGVEEQLPYSEEHGTMEPGNSTLGDNNENEISELIIAEIEIIPDTPLNDMEPVGENGLVANCNFTRCTGVSSPEILNHLPGPSTERNNTRERTLNEKVNSQAVHSRRVNQNYNDDDTDDSASTNDDTDISGFIGNTRKRMAKVNKGNHPDKKRKYWETSVATKVSGVDFSDQESTISESTMLTIGSHLTEVQESPDENPMPVTIRYIKSKGVEEKEYLVEGVVTLIEPPLKRIARKDLVSGYCSSCNIFTLYSSLITNLQTQELTCPNCPEHCRKTVMLAFAIRFHIKDKTNEELVVSLCGQNGVDFFGVTVKRYLKDPQIRKQIVDALCDLLPQNNYSRYEKKVRFFISSYANVSGMQYLIRKTYLCFSHLGNQ